MARPALAASALLLVLASCTRAGRDLPEVAPPSPAEQPTGPALEAAGRLAVVDGQGRIVTMRPDGSDPVPLTEAAGGGLQFLQPAWSPDGRRLAWVEFDDRSGSRVSRIVTAAVDGTGRTEARPASLAFYLAWDPTSARLAYLGSLDGGLELGIVEVAAGGGSAAPLDTGSPYYFSWAPEGDRLVVHVGEDRLERLTLDGSLARVARPGAFRAPVWGPAGLVYAALGDDGQRIRESDERGGRARDLVTFDGTVAFVLSPDGGRLAFQALGAAGGGEAAGGVSRAAPGELAVLDLGSGEVRRVSEAPALAFFWSPTGDRLLVLLAEASLGPPWVRWHLWDGEAAVPAGPPFQPSPVFLQGYLPFFDQFAQSTSLWAPDGSAFAYPGLNQAGERGIWVQTAPPAADPVLVATDGSFVTWSPAG